MSVIRDFRFFIVNVMVFKVLRRSLLSTLCTHLVAW